MEAIILAGGLGTRLKEAVPDLPKCMAPVNNRPFIAYVLDHLQQQGVDRFIFSLGYRSEAFTGFIEARFPPEKYQLVIEEEPLGTGGAIRLGCTFAREKDAVVVNGDSIFKIDFGKQLAFHSAQGADCTLALKPMVNFDRYGTVVLHPDQTIASFREKQFCKQGLISGGVYVLNTQQFLQEALPDKFSFETDYLQKYFAVRKIYGVVQDAYFIDIGIPGDYRKAQEELKP